ncbi:hypothetical protein HOD30_00655 [Candidatus Peregrinibacteria bacterium]|jgi:hypothetical protein|nr:hypothetical protein [Candidatus Peregrinibacteria bacterium]MBT4631949.1 hypothetical protein [Candidatus Peregrinibacteria bacterium]MBT5517150.1 hypothetical protein [Candidatus Peregrinibacteria bacterium]MBT5823663.1 hypothetical protein [Candidatus Peregrinibacteria bacterium]
MKAKNILILALTAASLLLVGCTGAENREPSSRNYETIVGEFKSLAGIRVDKSITHLFEDEDGNIYYAFSEKYDLGREDKQSTRVEVYGVVLAYEDLDKDVFEVRRISDIPEEEIEEIAVGNESFKSTSMGFSFQYPAEWSLSKFVDSVRIDAPKVENEDEDNEEGVELELDYMTAGKLDHYVELSNILTRDADIHEYATANYPDATLRGEAFLGTDSQFAMHYETANGDLLYFMPRSDGQLFELSFFHPSDDETMLGYHKNDFARLLSSFRFIPFETELEVSDEETEEVEDPEVEPEPEPAAPISDVEQVSEDTYHEFESSPFNFKISYPASWYYSGGAGGYDFNPDPIEDEVDALLRLDLNANSTEGRSTIGSTVTITIELDGRYYSISGPAEYEEVIQVMIDSITATEDEE